MARKRLVRRAIASLLVTTLVLALAPSVAAFHTLGGKWSSVYNLPYWYYTSVAVDRTAYGSAIGDWNGTATPIWMVSAGHVDYEDVGLFSTTNSGVGWDGLTFLSPSNSANPYTYAQVTLNNYYTGAYSAAQRRSVAGHELGHVFGLAHESGSVLMNPYTCGANSRWCTYSINTPTGDDVNGINAIY